MSVGRVYERGETILFPRVHFVRGDWQIVQADDLFYVTVESRKELQGGYVPGAIVESWSFFSFGEALNHLSDLERGKQIHCQQFNCE